VHARGVRIGVTRIARSLTIDAPIEATYRSLGRHGFLGSSGSTGLAENSTTDNFRHRLPSAVHRPDGNLDVSSGNGSATGVIYQAVAR
jgi:hypothetical protein